MPDALQVPHPCAAGLTVTEVAKRYRVSPDKVRGWIKSGELPAVNTGATLCGKPRYVVTADGLAAFEKRRSAAAPPKLVRRKRRGSVIDFYPDEDG